MSRELYTRSGFKEAVFPTRLESGARKKYLEGYDETLTGIVINAHDVVEFDNHNHWARNTNFSVEYLSIIFDFGAGSDYPYLNPSDKIWIYIGLGDINTDPPANPTYFYIDIVPIDTMIAATAYISFFNKDFSSPILVPSNRCFFVWVYNYCNENLDTAFFYLCGEQID